LADVHVNGVELLNGGQGHGLIGRHQGAVGDAGLADAPGNGRSHPGIAQIDAGPFHLGLPIFDVGPGLIHGRSRVVEVLLADRLVRQQFLVAFGLQADGRQIGPGLAQGRLGRVQGHLKGRRVNLVQQLPGFDIGAFPEQAFLDDAIDLGANFRHQIGRGAARQLGGQLHRLRLNGQRGHFRDRGRPALLPLAAAAARQQNYQGQRRAAPFQRFMTIFIQVHQKSPQVSEVSQTRFLSS
jgi:hypothetical protein